MRGCSSLIDFFIEKVAMVNNRNYAGNTALHYCANKGHEEAVALLLRKGSVVNSRNGTGWTVSERARDVRHGAGESIDTRAFRRVLRHS